MHTPDHPTTEAAPVHNMETTPTITIGHLEVYNFPALVPCPRIRPQPTFWPSRNTSTSSGPICRICHEGDAVETLLAPCNCTGTIALVHVSCMERWLGTIETDSCELCHYKFQTSKMPRPFYDFMCHWLRGPSGLSQQRSMIGDAICFCLLTPIAIASVFLCMDGALQQFMEGSQMEAGCLLGLSSVLASIYVVWLSITIRYYYRNFRTWQATNQDVHIIGRTSPRPLSSPNSRTRTTVVDIRNESLAPGTRTPNNCTPESVFNQSGLQPERTI